MHTDVYPKEVWGSFGIIVIDVKRLPYLVHAVKRVVRIESKRNTDQYLLQAGNMVLDLL